MSTPEVEWADPPPRTELNKPRHGRMKAFVELLKENPGQWAVYPHSRSASISTRLKGYGCETAIRDATTPDCKVYVRWPQDH